MELYEHILLQIAENNPQIVSLDSEKIKKLFCCECYKVLKNIQTSASTKLKNLFVYMKNRGVVAEPDMILDDKKQAVAYASACFN